MRFLICCLIVWSGVSSAYAQSQAVIIIDRPDFTESPYCLQAGVFQIETGVHIQDRAEFGGMFRLGLAKNLEVRTLIYGHTLPEIGLKYTLYGSERHTYGLALTGVNVLEHAYRLVFSHDIPISESFTFAYNTGAYSEARPQILDQKTAQTDFHACFSHIYVFSLHRRLSVFVEGVHTRQFAQSSAFAHTLNSGLAFQIQPNLFVDGMVGFQETGFSGLQLGISLQPKMKFPGF